MAALATAAWGGTFPMISEKLVSMAASISYSIRFQHETISEKLVSMAVYGLGCIAYSSSISEKLVSMAVGNIQRFSLFPFLFQKN